MKLLHIFKSGKHTSAQGITLDFTDAMLQAAAAAYDPALHEAPITVGHPKDNLPAYGWVKGLSFADGNLNAEPHQVDTAFNELVEAGRFKKISASFYTPDSPANPKPGSYYLRHVAFLGAQPPAIKGLKAVAFQEGEQGVVDFTDWTLAAFGRRFRDWLLEKFGAEDADKVMPDYLVANMEDAARAAMATETPAPAYSESDAMPMTAEQIAALEAKAARAAELEEANTRLQAQVTSFAEREGNLAERERAQARAAIEAQVDTLVTSGHVLPAQKAELVAYMETLPQATVLEFGEGDAKKSTPVRDWLLGFIGKMPPQVDFQERGRGARPGADQGTPDQVARQAVEFREREAKAGREITAAEAVDAVLAGRAAA